MLELTEAAEHRCSTGVHLTSFWFAFVENKTGAVAGAMGGLLWI